eukprot:2573756-Pyramimonas_sp.AAC.1
MIVLGVVACFLLIFGRLDSEPWFSLVPLVFSWTLEVLLDGVFSEASLEAPSLRASRLRAQGSGALRPWGS